MNGERTASNFVCDGVTAVVYVIAIPVVINNGLNAKFIFGPNPGAVFPVIRNFLRRWFRSYDEQIYRLIP